MSEGELLRLRLVEEGVHMAAWRVGEVVALVRSGRLEFPEGLEDLLECLELVSGRFVGLVEELADEVEEGGVGICPVGSSSG